MEYLGWEKGGNRIGLLPLPVPKELHTRFRTNFPIVMNAAQIHEKETIGICHLKGSVFSGVIRTVPIKKRQHEHQCQSRAQKNLQDFDQIWGQYRGFGRHIG
jgi:hypothetical protein